MAGDEEDDEVHEAHEVRVAAQAGSGRRLLRRVAFISIMSVASLYLCALERGERATSSSSPSWHPPLSFAALYGTLVKDYSYSSGLFDVACLTFLHAVSTAVVLRAATPCDRRRASLENVRMAGKHRR